MKYSTVLATSAFLGLSLSATIPSEPWTTLTPTASAPSGATTDYDHKFGIQIKTISSASATASASSGTQKRDILRLRDSVNQIGDGQIQEQSQSLETPAPLSASVVNQIGDGQIQHQTTAASVVNQIGDGQIQHQTTAASVINQIGDGQIQHQTASAVNQIGDGQIQNQESAAATATAASQISDGQVQATDAAESDDDSGIPSACLTDNSLSMTLSNSVLTDSKGRIGAIVANRQFQFDGPPPQAGSIYAAGWSITSDGYLALGNQTEFYQCKSGDFYNLYDENNAAQCSGVKLSIIDLVLC